MIIPHEPWLVVLSIAIAIQGSFVGLSLARGLDSAEGFRRRLALAGSAITLATGVWSMHFVAMLAANFPSAVDYLVLPTLISFLICVIVVGIGVYAAHASGPPALRIGTGALAMGLGVSLMHYVGISASSSGRANVARTALSHCRGCDRDRRQRFRPVDDRQPADPSAVVPGRGCARPGDFRNALHGDGRDAPRPAVLRRFAFRRRPKSALSRNTLALLATVVAFGVSGAFLLSLVPDTRGPRSAGARPAEAEPAAPLAPMAAPHGLEPTPFQESPSAEPPPVAPPAGPMRLDPGREGRTHARDRRQRHLRHPRQRPLHLCPRRGEGIFLQSLDQRARSAPRSQSVPEKSTAVTSSRSIASRGSGDRAKPASPNSDCLCAAASRLRAPTTVRSSSGSARSPAKPGLSS